LSFHLSTARGGVYGRRDGSGILGEAPGKTDQRPNFTASGPIDPFQQSSRFAAEEHLAEFQTNLPDSERVGALRRKPVPENLLCAKELISRSGGQNCCVSGRDSLGSIWSGRSSAFPPTRNKLGYHRTASAIAELSDLMKQLGSIVAALHPAAAQVLRKLLHVRRAPPRLLAFWELSGT
jgi:hypothetical protein